MGDIPIGSRVKFFREGRGLTQVQLAVRTGISIDYIGLIERGLRTPSQRYLHLIAEALGVSADTLRGQASFEPGGVGHPGIPAIQDALLGLGELAVPIELSEMQARIDLVGDAWFAATERNYARTAELLPGLIRQAEWLRGRYTTPQEEDDRRRAAALIFHTYYLARQFSRSVGSIDVAVATRERMLAAADATDDPSIIATSQWSLTLQLLADDYLDAADEVGRRNLQVLSSRAETMQNGHVLQGMQHAALSVVAVRRGHIAEARRLVEEADRIGQRTGSSNWIWSAWGPTNVAIYMIEIEAEHGSPDLGIRVADRLTPDMVAALPVTERRARLSTILAWLYEQLDQDPGVIMHLKRAQAEAPEEFRYSILSQQLVSRLLGAARPSYQREAVELAEKVGLLA